MAIQDQLNAYKQQINNDISTQVDPDSIAPDMVGSIGIDLADILLPELLKINNFGIDGGIAMPSGGIDKDLYYKAGLNQIEIYRNLLGTWIKQATIPLGVSYPDGIITGLRTSLKNGVVTVSAGAWVINNLFFTKTTQTQLNLAAKDNAFDRWDLIYADNTGSIALLNGIPAANPIQPAKPLNSIIVDYVYVPTLGAAYLASGQVVVEKEPLIFTQADIIDLGGGDWYLPVNLTGKQTATAMRIKRADNSTYTIFPSEKDGKIFGMEDPALQNYTVYLFVEGEAVASTSNIPVAGQLLLLNTASQAINYEDNFGPTIVLAASAVFNKNPFVNNQYFKTIWPAGTDITIQAYDPDGTPYGFPFVDATGAGGNVNYSNLLIVKGYKIEIKNH